MIVCRYRAGFVAWEPGPTLDYVPLVDLSADEADAELARLKLAFSKPADVPEARELPNGGIADGFRSEPPGSADHARGVMRTLEGVTFLIDDG
jgi:hypothetical protein